MRSRYSMRESVPLNVTLALLASLAIHLALVTLFSPTHKTVTYEGARPSQHQAIRIAPYPKPEVKNPLVEEKSPPVARIRSSPPRGGSKVKPRPEVGRSAEHDVKKLKYEDLLPFPKGATGGKGILTRRTPYSGSKLGKLLEGASDFRSYFDLPLVFRRSITDGRGWTWLLLRGDHIWVEFLGGKPEIRAAIFETLKMPRSYPILLQVFEDFGVDRIKLGVTFKTDFFTPSHSEFRTQNKVYDHEIEITLLRYMQAPQYGDGNIEDVHSLKAQARDRRHWSRLANSIAFRKPVRNYPLEKVVK